MSRIGKRPIEILSGVKASLKGNTIAIESSGKTCEYKVPDKFKIVIENNKILITRPSDIVKDRTMHGTIRSLIQSMIIGVKTGFQKKLEIQGVGYKAIMKGKVLELEIGKSHPIKYETPVGITIQAPTQTSIVVSGIDKQKVGAVAAEIRQFYPPEPYKGKGIRYVGEYVRKKEGKSVA
ncbi:Ribosomal protein L6, subgroup [Candidatus Omnitrophus magneticus]|uniref:Large ribosomal subunit protein uL6 n=1 Tax=Candidatus Omnitrophus magneticus TaxID=1609969 RepID=A0A0F0CLY5_9BACT|nr:Ribosomal protein L6, subgroup [Candidatus Omnitrophus magneticus]